MDVEKNRVAVRTWGAYACFTRPEMKVERVTYDILTPSAARGILEAIYWKPQIKWVVDRIHVLKPIRFTNVRRNEVANKAVGPTKSQLAGGKGDEKSLVIENDRQQRAATILRDVDYVIEAHYETLERNGDSPNKHYEIFKRRAEKGQSFHHPYLGCREWIAHFAWQPAPAPPCDSSLQGKQDLGWMLHDLVYIPDKNGKIVEAHQGRKLTAKPHFFRAEMNDGVVDIPALDSQEVRS